MAYLNMSLFISNIAIGQNRMYPIKFRVSSTSTQNHNMAASGLFLHVAVICLVCVGVVGQIYKRKEVINS